MPTTRSHSVVIGLSHRGCCFRREAVFFQSTTRAGFCLPRTVCIHGGLVDGMDSYFPHCWILLAVPFTVIPPCSNPMVVTMKRTGRPHPDLLPAGVEGGWSLFIFMSYLDRVVSDATLFDPQGHVSRRFNSNSYSVGAPRRSEDIHWRAGQAFVSTKSDWAGYNKDVDIPDC